MKIAQVDTAISAFHNHTGKSAQCSLILDFIQKRGGSWSIGELANALDFQKSTISARINELLHDGRLEEKLKRKDRISNITVRPVGLPAVQKDLFGEAV